MFAAARSRNAAINRSAVGASTRAARASLCASATDWQFMDFLGPKGRESPGIVDILAIRKSGRAPSVKGLKKLDAFDMQIIQVKGGKANVPTTEGILRLRPVQNRYGADRVVLFEWWPPLGTAFRVLDEKVDRLRHGALINATVLCDSRATGHQPSIAIVNVRSLARTGRSARDCERRSTSSAALPCNTIPSSTAT